MGNKVEIIKSARLGESYTRVDHSSGLTMLLYPMEGYNSAYALFGTKYGSVDTCFKLSGEEDFANVPDGIAHFLEHKLFENEDGDAFQKYASTGASPNAYTSFDRTAYLFSCTENFDQALEILLDFVAHPYFTKETVEKEQGIIGQEIKMYDDSPDWQVYKSLLKSLYHEHPIRNDIAGTVESIAEIDADILYRCYNTFYNLGNMVLCIAGNFDPQAVIEMADKMLKSAEDIEIVRGSVQEPSNICREYSEQILPVALPLFHLGFKADPGTELENASNHIKDEIILDIIAGESTPLYRRLYDEGLINSEFGCEAMSGRDYAFSVFAGESRDPKRVRDDITAEIERIKKQGIDEDTFERYKKASYGNYIGMFGRVESVASFMLISYFSGIETYRVLEMVAAVTLEDLQKRLDEAFDVNRCALSVVRAG